MPREITVRVHSIAEDGPPDVSATLDERVALLFDGRIVSGWPLAGSVEGLWEADPEVGHNRPFDGVTHWVEFPVPLDQLERGSGEGERA